MKTIVGKVYANWCGHCQELEPKWKALTTMLPPSRFEFVDFEEAESQKRSDFENKHGIKLNVSGYPTIFKMNPKRKVEYYSGPREPKDMKQWALSKAKKTRKTNKAQGRFRRSRRTRKNRPMFGNFF